MDTSDEEEIQAESQQTPEQIAAGLGAKKKEQERLRNLVAQKQQTSSLPALSNQLANRRRNTNPGGKRKEEKGGEKKGKIYFGVSICPQNRLKKNSPPAAEQRPAGCARSTLLAHRPLAHRRLPLRRNTGERAAVRMGSALLQAALPPPMPATKVAAPSTASSNASVASTPCGKRC